MSDSGHLNIPRSYDLGHQNKLSINKRNNIDSGQTRPQINELIKYISLNV